MSARAGKSADRQGLIRLIHVAKRDLRMDEDGYRSVLVAVTQKNSSADMTTHELERVIDHLKRGGFKVRSKSTGVKKPSKATTSRPLAQYPEATKIRALWLFLHDLGAIENKSEEALAAYVKRITKVDALQWVNGYQAETLIESMKKWAMRFLPERTKSLALQVAADIESGKLQLDQETTMQLRTLVLIAQRRQTFDPMHAAWDALTNAIKGESRDANCDAK